MAEQLIQYLRLNATADTSGIKDMDASLGTLDKHVESSSNLFSKISTAAKVASVATGAALVAGLGASVKSAADFEQKMNDLSAATGATGDELKQLHDYALQIGKDTPKSAGEAADALTELSKAGVSTKDIIGGIGRTVVDMATATGQTVPAMADLLVAGMQSFGAAASDANHYANTLSAAAQASTLDIGDFAAALQTGGATAKSANLSIDSFSAAVATLGNNGIKGAEAGTTLKTMLLSLEAPSNTAAAAMDSIGFNAFDAQGKMKPFADILHELSEKFSGLTEEERDYTAKAIFGTYGINAANILLKDHAAGYDAMTAAMGKQLSVADQTKIRMQGLEGQIEQLKGSLETIAITVGEAFLPALTKAATAATGFVNGIIDKWPQIVGTVKSVGSALKTTFDPFLASFDTFFGNDASLASKLEDVGRGLVYSFANIPWGQIFSTVGNIAGKFWDGFVQVLTVGADFGGQLIGAIVDQLSKLNIGDAIKDALAGAGTGAAVGAVVGGPFGAIAGAIIGALAAALGDAISGNKLSDFLNSLQSKLGDVVSNIDWVAVWNRVVNIGQAFGQMLASHRQEFGNQINGMFDKLDQQGGGASKTSSLFKDIGDSLGSFLQGLGPSQKAMDEFTASLQPLTTALERFLNEAVKPVAEAIGAVLLIALDGLLKALDGLGFNGSHLLQLITDQIHIFTDALNIVSDVVQLVVALITGDWPKAWEEAKRAFSDTVQFVIDTVKSWWDLISPALENILSGARRIFGAVYDFVSGKLHDLWQWINDNFVHPIEDAIEAPFKAASDFLTGTGGFISDLVSKITDGFHKVWDWLNKEWKDIENVFEAPFKAIASGLTNILAPALAPVREFISHFNDLGHGVRDVVGWITGKINIPNPFADFKDLVPGFATGVQNWQGGYAWVGERGPEIMYVPAGATIVPAEQSAMLASVLPGFQFGLGDIGDALKGLAGDALSTFTGWLGKGAEWLLNQAMDAIGFNKIGFGNLISGFGPAILGKVKDWLLGAVKELLDTGNKAIPSAAIIGAINYTGGDLSAAQLFAGLQAAGMPSDAARTMTAILLAESGGNIAPPNAAGAAGFAQFIPSTAAAYGLSQADLLSHDPVSIAKVFAAVVALWKNSGFAPWDAYSYVAGNGPYGEAFVGPGQGSYRGFLPIVNSLDTGGVLAEDIIGRGTNSGETYRLHSGETVVPAGPGVSPAAGGNWLAALWDTSTKILMAISGPVLDALKAMVAKLETVSTTAADTHADTSSIKTSTATTAAATTGQTVEGQAPVTRVVPPQPGQGNDQQLIDYVGPGGVVTHVQPDNPLVGGQRLVPVIGPGGVVTYVQPTNPLANQDNSLQGVDVQNTLENGLGLITDGIGDLNSQLDSANQSLDTIIPPIQDTAGSVSDTSTTVSDLANTTTSQTPILSDTRDSMSSADASLFNLKEINGWTSLMLGATQRGFNVMAEWLSTIWDILSQLFTKLSGDSAPAKKPAVSLATGGIVSSPTLALVGDAGSPELIAPLTLIAEVVAAGIARGFQEIEAGGTFTSNVWKPFTFSTQAIQPSAPVSSSAPSESSSKGGMPGFWTPKSDGPGFDFIPLTFPAQFFPMASGGWINEPVVGIGLRTHKDYSIAEYAPEYVGTPQSGDTYHLNFNEGSITIPARDLAEMKSVNDFFARVIQEKRARYGK